MMEVQPLTPDVLHGLIQGPLISSRTDCSRRDTLSVSINDFVPTDQQTIQHLTTTLQALLQMIDAWQNHGEEIPHAVRTFIQQSGWWQVIQSVQHLGDATFASHTSLALARAIHDLKGGGLTALAMMLPVMASGLATDKEVHRTYSLTRDHLRMMGNCVRDLDPAPYEHNRQNQARSMRQVAEMWDRAEYTLPDQTVHVLVHDAFTGAVAASRVEFAALNRAVYNLMNNAICHTTDGYVYISVMGLPDRQPRDARFVVYNRISADHRQTLLRYCAMDLGALFRGGFTTGGSGLGLRICAEFVTAEYHLASVDRCIKSGYVGAALYDAYFVTWIHWPAA